MKDDTLSYTDNLKPSNLLHIAEEGRLQYSLQKDSLRQVDLGQYFTAAHTAQFMASLFSETQEPVILLDAGAGAGTLTAAFVGDACQRSVKPSAIRVTAVEQDTTLLPLLHNLLNHCLKVCSRYGISFTYEVINDDFIEYASDLLRADGLFSQPATYSHAILNPPYGKINSQSKHRLSLRAVAIETVNLYAAFVALSVKLLRKNGELVAITPRSFCNGPYYKPFRQLLLGEMALRHIHVFNSRDTAFSDDDVLQENIIYHAVKRGHRDQVKISSSDADYSVTRLFESGMAEHDSANLDETSKLANVTNTRYYPDDTIARTVEYKQVVSPADPDLFINIATHESDQMVADRVRSLCCKLDGLSIAVSTGRVVDFRAKDYLRAQPAIGTVPLIYPGHLQRGAVIWPQLGSKKPNAIVSCLETHDLLLPAGVYVVVKRFTSKEETKRIVAAIYDPAQVPAEEVAFENHLNVFHWKSAGLSPTLARGLALYLNSTLVDTYFRLFNGHTQVNATDLRTLQYPSREELEHLGTLTETLDLSQEEIDTLVSKELAVMTDSPYDLFQVQKRIDEALTILRVLGLPRSQQNERSALTLLALLDLKPITPWSQAESPLIGITPIMDYMRDHYGKHYAPNTRETVRRQTMHQFVEARIAVLNPDDPSRAVNSPHSHYQITSQALRLVRHYGLPQWEEVLSLYIAEVGSLNERYPRRRNMPEIPVTLSDGSILTLTPGQHNELIKAIIEKFGAKFAAGGVVLYVGDTGGKLTYFDKEAFANLGVVLDSHGKMPDVVIHYLKEDWLLLIEAVTSHGPVDGKRRDELRRLFGNARPGLIYVTAFLTKKDMKKYLANIAWETEVWAAEAPEHIIHFDGKRFLGPYESK